MKLRLFIAIAGWLMISNAAAKPNDSYIGGGLYSADTIDEFIVTASVTLTDRIVVHGFYTQLFDSLVRVQGDYYLTENWFFGAGAVSYSWTGGSETGSLFSAGWRHYFSEQLSLSVEIGHYDVFNGSDFFRGRLFYDITERWRLGFEYQSNSSGLMNDQAITINYRF